MHTISAAWTLATKDLKSFVRDRTALLLTILVPIALVTVFGWIMAYAFGGSGAMPKVRLHVADLSQSEASQEFVDQLTSSEMLRVRLVDTGSDASNSGDESEGESASNSIAELEKLVRNGDATHVLVIPATFATELEAGTTPSFQMLRDPGREMEDRMIQIGVMQAAMASLGPNVMTDAMDRILSRQGMDTASLGSIRGWMTDISDTIGGFYEETEESDTAEPDAVASEDRSEDSESELAPGADEEQSTAGGGMDMNGIFEFMSDAVPMETTDIEPPQRPQRVTYQQAQSVAGMSVMMLLFALTSCGSVLLTEREDGTLRRLFAQPISRNAVLLGKFFFVMCIGIAQIAILFTYGEFMFGVGLFRDPVTLVILSLVWVATGGAFGMFLASVSRSTKQAESLASLLILMMAALGGCWFPLQMMNLPTVLDTICKSTMTFWAMTGFQSMLWNQLPWYSSKVATAISFQLGWAIALTGLAVFFYRRNFCRG